jgi:hypothetical protein
MPVVISAVFPGVGLDDYREVHRRVMERGPEGILVHTAGVTEDGLRVVDVWESAEAFQRFQETVLGPAAADSGLAGVQPTPGASALAEMANFGMAS